MRKNEKRMIAFILCMGREKQVEKNEQKSLNRISWKFSFHLANWKCDKTNERSILVDDHNNQLILSSLTDKWNENERLFSANIFRNKKIVPIVHYMFRLCIFSFLFLQYFTFYRSFSTNRATISCAMWMYCFFVYWSQCQATELSHIELVLHRDQVRAIDRIPLRY